MPFARSDLVSVSVPRSAGGCGQRHCRPYENGSPAAVWALDHETCTPCANVLAHDDLWSGTLAEIPETPDETREREQREKNASAEQEKALGNLPGNLAGALGPAFAAALVPVLAAMGVQVPQSVSCPAGHPNAAGVKFCGECGSPMGFLPGAVVPDVVQSALSGPQRAAAAAKAPRPFKDWNADELRAEARRLGLSEDGTRAALKTRILSAKAAA